MTIIEFLSIVETTFPYIYSLLFVVSIATFKRLTSLSIIVVLLALFEFTSNEITYPFLDLVNDKSIAYAYRLSAWAGFWMLYVYAQIVLLQKAHIWLNVTKGKELVFVQWGLLSIILLFMVSLIDRIFIQNSVLDILYRLGIPALNLSIAGFLLFAMLKQVEFKKWKTQS